MFSITSKSEKTFLGRASERVIITSDAELYELAEQHSDTHPVLVEAAGSQDTEMSAELEAVITEADRAGIIVSSDIGRLLPTIETYAAEIGISGKCSKVAVKDLKEAFKDAVAKAKADAAEVERLETLRRENASAMSFRERLLYRAKTLNIPTFSDIPDAAEWVAQNLGVCSTNGDWYIWNESYWEKMDVAEGSFDITEVYRLEGDDKVATSLNTPKHFNAFMAQIKLRCARPLSSWEQDREYILFPDNTVLSTVDLSQVKHEQKLPLYRTMAHTPAEPGAEPRRFLKALREDYGFDEQTITYLQLMAGAALLGRSIKNWSVWVGGSNTGKTSLLETLRRAYGGYGVVMPKDALGTSDSSKGLRYIAKGARFLMLDEAPDKNIDGTFMKSLVGSGTEVQTRQIYKAPESWVPQCVLFTASNHMLKLDAMDNAIGSRVDTLRFENVLTGRPEESRNWDVFINEQEGPELVRWILDGAQRFIREYDGKASIAAPAHMKAAMDELAAEQSLSVEWLTEALLDDYSENGAFLLDIRGTEVKQAHWALATKPQDAYAEFSSWYTSQYLGRQTSALMPKPKQWREDICRYMGAPDSFIRARQAKGPQLYGLVLSSNKSVALSDGAMPAGLAVS